MNERPGCGMGCMSDAGAMGGGRVDMIWWCWLRDGGGKV
jgi:hypothetical protein